MQYHYAKDAYSHRARGSNRKKLRTSTYLYHDETDDSYFITYHGNRIICFFRDNSVSFHNLVWITSPTTRARFNDYSPLSINRGYYRLRDWDSLSSDHFFVHMDDGAVLPLVEDVPYHIDNGNKEFFGPLHEESALELDIKIRQYAMRLALDLFNFRLKVTDVEPLSAKTPYEDVRIMVEHQLKSGALVNAAMSYTDLSELDKEHGWLWSKAAPKDEQKRVQWMEHRMKNRFVETTIRRTQAERMLVHELQGRLWFRGNPLK